jgi:hypothetical protein
LIEKLSKEISAAQPRAAVLTRKADSASALLAAVVAGGGLISSTSARADDLFDASQGATVFDSSGGNVRTMFSATPGHTESDGMTDHSSTPATVFQKGKSPGYRHWVEWTTKQRVKIRSVGLFARHDDAGVNGVNFGRSFDEFSLYDWEGRWVRLVTYNPSLPYGAGNGTGLAVCLPVQPATAQRFRAVFVPHGLLGPRVVAMDGNADTCDQQYPSFRG